jgi:hypothetical protein
MHVSVFFYFKFTYLPSESPTQTEHLFFDKKRIWKFKYYSQGPYLEIRRCGRASGMNQSIKIFLDGIIFLVLLRNGGPIEVPFYLTARTSLCPCHTWTLTFVFSSRHATSLFYFLFRFLFEPSSTHYF